MNEITVRPTAKFLKAGAALAAVVFLALEIAYFAYWRDLRYLQYLPYAVPLVFVWPAARWLRRQCSKAVLSGDRLRYETGVISKSTRNIQLSKVQDVRVDQRIMQRIFGVGDVSIETAGESSRLTIRNVDAPQTVADEIMTRSQKGTGPV